MWTATDGQLPILMSFVLCRSAEMVVQVVDGATVLMRATIRHPVFT